jgi:ubiquinone/menaquinone biosynthesis C-methylase UbiE
MPSMSRIEAAFCRNPVWTTFTRRTVLPWALGGQTLTGAVLELGAGSGAMAEAVLTTFPNVTITATDYDEKMVEASRRRLARHAPRARAEQADATDLAYADGSLTPY